MGLFGKSKKEREKEYMNRLDVPLCLKEDFELIIDDIFTIMGVGTVDDVYKEVLEQAENFKKYAN